MSKKPLPSIQTVIFRYFFILIIAIVIVLDIFFIYQIRHTVKKDAHIYTYEIVKQAGRNIDNYIKHMEDIAGLLVNDSEIKAQLNQKKILRDNRDISLYRNETLEKFKTMGSTNGDIVSIFVFGDNNVVLADNNYYKIKPYMDIKNAEWYKKAIQARGNPVVSSAHIQNYLEEDPKWVFSVSAAIMDDNQVLGVILIDMNYKTISDIFYKIKLGEKGYIYVVQDDREIIYHPKQQLIYSKLMHEDIESVFRQGEGSYISNKNRNLITIHTIPKLKWKIVGVSYLKELLFVQKDLIIAIIAFTGVCIALAFIASQIIAKDISRPIKELQEIMLQVEYGNMDATLKSKGNNKEIASLSKSFQNMIIRMKELLEEVSTNERKLRKFEFKVLQAQINPHFLYNTLDTIIWLGEKEEHERVVLMTSALAKYFRLSLSKGEDIIPIKSEIDQVENYLIIQKIRYNNKLRYEIDIEPEILYYYTIKLTLQPLVENALYHGIKDKAEGGTIRISGKKIENDICIIVEDDGRGMSKEQLSNILKIKTSNYISTGGIAIKNVHERLQIYFGERYGLKYESELGKGTKVYVWIPAKNEIEIDSTGKFGSRDMNE